MNERIQELAKQAGFHFDAYNEVTNRKAELFAELIVRECADIADKAEPYKSNDSILKHFAVKE